MEQRVISVVVRRPTDVVAESMGADGPVWARVDLLTQSRSSASVMCRLVESTTAAKLRWHMGDHIDNSSYRYSHK